MVCNTSCWRSVIMTLAALPGMARTSPSVGEIGGLGKYRKTRAIVEARFSQRVLARCLDKLGQPSAAAERLAQALDLLDTLVSKDPQNQALVQRRGRLLVDLVDVLLAGGRSSEAQTAYQQGLQVAERLSDLRGQTVILDRFAQLAMNSHDYTLAGKCYTTARDLYQAI